MPKDDYQFLDIESTPPWSTSHSTYNRHRNTTYDRVNYSRREHKLILGNYFIYSSNKFEHSRVLMDYIGVFSALGGLQALLMSVFSLFGNMINDKLKQAKLIRSLFFINNSHGQPYLINFSLFDKFSDFNCCAKGSRKA